MWSARFAQMGRSPIKSRTRTPVGLIQSDWIYNQLYIQLHWELRSLACLSPSLSLISSCHGKVVREGNATTDNVCHPEAFTSNKPRLTSTKEPYTETTFTTMSTVTSTASDTKVPGGSTDFKLPRNASEAVFNHSTKNLSPNTASDNTLGMVANIVFWSNSNEKSVLRSCHCLLC